MALPTGLVPITVFATTVGIAVSVAVGAHLFSRSGTAPFGAALRAALVTVGGLYLAGVLVVWALAGGLPLWEVAATLLVAGLGNLVVLTALPLFVGRHVVRRVGGADSDAALRYATYGWPVAMLAVFAVFVASGGLRHGDLLVLGGGRTCLAGHCGVPLLLTAAVFLELAVAVLGPGVAGLALYSAGTGARTRTTRS